MGAGREAASRSEADNLRGGGLCVSCPSAAIAGEVHAKCNEGAAR